MKPLKLEASPDLVERVYSAISEAIAVGTLAPGARLTQEELAQTFAVSRQPVLQALKLLKKDGLVLDAPGRGLMVAPLDALLIEQVYQVRGALDALAARLAAKKGCAIDMVLIDQGRKAVKGKKIAYMVDADIAFHRAVYEAAGNDLITVSAKQHWQHIRRAMGAVLQSNGMRACVWDEHEAIAKAINSTEAKRAEQLMRVHSESAGEHMAYELANVKSKVR
jgi:DNA-binding GntR family transcriptional regulator